MSAQARRRLLVGAIYGALLALGVWIGIALEGLEPGPHSSIGTAPDQPGLQPMIMLALVAFVLLSALPFVPGAEIGFGLLVLFGGKVALAVYGAMVLALTVSFLVGTLVPARWIGRFLGFLGLRRARELVNRLQALPRTQRIDFLIARAPARFVPTLLRHRYLALIIVLNLPGNSLLGGGGGLALAAGMSGVFSLPGFVATVALAVAPVPLVFYFTM